MAFQQFTDLYGKIGLFGLEDNADRLNRFTVILFGLAAALVGVKQYGLNDISCYIPVSPDGEKFKEFVNDYCWVHGTIPLLPGERFPEGEAKWEMYDKVRRITYYQWTPFVFALQCIMFYLPHLIWQVLSTQRAGGDLIELTKAAAEAASSERGTRATQVNRVAEFLKDMIDGQRDVNRQNLRRRLVRRAYDTCGICVVSKRMGTCLVFSYLAIKLLAIVNAILQIYLIQRLLGFHTDGSFGAKSMELSQTAGDQSGSKDSYEVTDWTGLSFGLLVLNHIWSGRDWPETMLFPRVAFCHVPKIRSVGVANSYTAQCALPINMLNEKLYIFFWFWIVFLVCASVVSLILWLARMVISTRRQNFIKRFLRVKGFLSVGTQRRLSRADLDGFIEGYLRRDGVFLVRMLSLNAGEVITAEIVAVLYNDYLEHLDSSEEKYSNVEDEKIKLSIENPPSYV